MKRGETKGNDRTECNDSLTFNSNMYFVKFHQSFGKLMVKYTSIAVHFSPTVSKIVGSHTQAYVHTHTPLPNGDHEDSNISSLTEEKKHVSVS